MCPNPNIVGPFVLVEPAYSTPFATVSGPISFALFPEPPGSFVVQRMVPVPGSSADQPAGERTDAT